MGFTPDGCHGSRLARSQDEGNSEQTHYQNQGEMKKRKRGVVKESRTIGFFDFSEAASVKGDRSGTLLRLEEDRHHEKRKGKKEKKRK